MHPWRGRSRPPQSNLPLGTPAEVLSERHPQLVGCETFLERPVRSFLPAAAPHREPRNPWARALSGALERHGSFGSQREAGLTLLQQGAVWHLAVEDGEIVGIVRDERLFPVRIALPVLGRHAEASLIDALEGRVESVEALLSGAVPDEVVSVLAASGALVPQLERMRARCQCPERGFCAHAAAVLLGLPLRVEEEPEVLFRLRRADPEVLKGLLPAALRHKPPAEAPVLPEDEVAQLFDLRLYRPRPLPAPPEPERAVASDSTDAEVASPGPTEAPQSAAAAREPRAREASDTGLPTDAPADIGRADLLELGLPSHRIQKMLTDGLLLRTGKRGRYHLTDAAWEIIEPLISEG